MAFPLAHPAAVLPLRRYCPRWLSFPALVIGSLSPDAGYCLGNLGGLDWGTFSHGMLGSVAFCLPVGVVLLALFYGLRAPVIRMLPAPYQQAFLPLCWRPPGSPSAVVISRLSGGQALFYGLRAPVIRMLPAPYQQAFLPLCWRPLGSPWAVVISLLIGVWTHLLWDSFTHNDGWCVAHRSEEHT